MMLLETRRLYLRNFELNDVDGIYNYRNTEACNKYQRWAEFTKEDIEAYILRNRENPFLSTKEEQHFAICSKSTTELVGELAYFYRENDCITLGITISYRYQRIGFAFEMLDQVIRSARAKYPEMDIVALIDPENTKSIKLFEKLGFVQESYADSISSYVYVIYGIGKKEEKSV